MIVIGKCKELYNDSSLPSIKDLIQEQPISEKCVVLEYLKHGKKGASAAGKATDIISGNPISDELCCYSDGEYGWRSDTIYYFEKYNIKLDEGFIRKALSN